MVDLSHIVIDESPSLQDYTFDDSKGQLVTLMTCGPGCVCGKYKGRVVPSQPDILEIRGIRILPNYQKEITIKLKGEK